MGVGHDLLRLVLVVQDPVEFGEHIGRVVFQGDVVFPGLHLEIQNVFQVGAGHQDDAVAGKVPARSTGNVVAGQQQQALV